MQLTVAQARAVGIKLPTKPKRPKKPPPLDTYVANDCVILAIDPAKVSGYCLVLPDHRMWTGAIAESQVAIVDAAIEAAEKAKRPLIVVAEKWTTGDRIHDRRMRAATLLGLGAAWERWRAALESSGVPRSRVVRVNVATWRAKVLGGPMNRTTEEWKEASLRYAQLRAHSQIKRNTSVPMQDDEADAICIAFWAMHSGLVAEAVKKAGRRYP